MNDDWECLSRAKLGDESAWNTLVDRHSNRMYNLAVMLTKSSDLANDVVQEAFYKLLTIKPKNELGKFSAYLLRIVYNHSLKEIKKTNRQTMLDEDVQGKDSSALEILLESERNKSIVRAIDGLPPRQREVALLRFYGQNSYTEIAAITGIPLGTVKSNIYYAVQNIRKELNRLGIIE